MAAKTRFNVTEACSTPRKMNLKDPFTQMVLKDPDGNTYDFYIYGAQSDIGRNALKERERRYGKNTVLGDEENAEVGAEYLAKVTQGWSNNLESLYDEEVTEVAYTHKRAVELYKEEDWIARQVIDFSLNTANYDPKRFLSSGAGSESSPGSKPPRKNQKATDGSN